MRFGSFVGSFAAAESIHAALRKYTLMLERHAIEQLKLCICFKASSVHVHSFTCSYVKTQFEKEL